MYPFERKDEHALSPFKVEYTNEHAVDQLSHHLVQRLHDHHVPHETVILCIGTDRSTGDALGPLVGSKLQSFEPMHLRVYGTLENPVHAMNLQDNIDYIHRTHPQSTVIAIDACLGQYSNVGNINVIDGPLKPGAGVKKELPSVGTFHITGIVNVGGFMEYFVLQNTRLHVVMQMADVIAKSLFRADLQFSASNPGITAATTKQS
ncbi:spore protease YyaC [Brevibacillus fulvus]|uniref:Sporulation protein YyaC n=1 Tax=Brevibacillus fulvus TaxID=1125967 RepID=A0A939BWH0_9BACL|nr:spore protease YyaC [Brevibacillus fulvus]MBM7591811.1 putative sporulation protein YyaC [Brevibacillus fulvus]